MSTLLRNRGFQRTIFKIFGQQYYNNPKSFSKPIILGSNLKVTRLFSSIDEVNSTEREITNYEPKTSSIQEVPGNFPPATDFGGSTELDKATEDPSSTKIDWSKSYFGLSAQPFSSEAAAILMQPVDPDDIECKPDGMIYLPEIKYRRVLNKAFGPGGWGLAPRGENSVTPRNISREYALVCSGRLVSVARGEQEYFDPSGLATAAEGCKSNALMRCCKDLGIASELWDPRFVREFKERYCEEVMVEHVVQKKKRKIWKRKDTPVDYPFKITSNVPYPYGG
ncbi:hypothetical protein G9A89_020046 [Geosiphon pyriformis]|nr:hypothetical protein G9A89_020046 [Geosiphon pyriformis]